MTNQCQRCRFWDRYESKQAHALNTRLGDCRRNPPLISEQILGRLMPGFGCQQTDDLELNVYAASAFPVTEEESWCGWFEAGALPSAMPVRHRVASEA